MSIICVSYAYQMSIMRIWCCDAYQALKRLKKGVRAGRFKQLAKHGNENSSGAGSTTALFDPQAAFIRGPLPSALQQRMGLRCGARAGPAPRFFY